jgi:hypothetical protein
VKLLLNAKFLSQHLLIKILNKEALSMSSAILKARLINRKKKTRKHLVISMIRNKCQTFQVLFKNHKVVVAGLQHPQRRYLELKRISKMRQTK